MPTIRIATHDKNGLHEEQKQNPCLDILCKYMRVYEIYIDKRDFPGPDIVTFCASESEWHRHYVSSNREEILNSNPPALINKTNKESTSEILYGDLLFSDDGSKITAYLPKDGKSVRISTDLTVLQYVTEQYRSTTLPTPKIVWYYDPEP